MARDDSRLLSKDFVNGFGAVETATVAFPAAAQPERKPEIGAILAIAGRVR
jgi:hypothetical protein